MKRKKVMTLANVLRIVKRLKRMGKTIVTTNGVFDILHPGHVRSLEEARAQGDVLIVGVNSDASVRALKGPTRPIQTVCVRAEMVLALRCVDCVFIFEETNPEAFLEMIRPHVHAKSSTYGKNLIDRDVVERHGGTFYSLKHYKGHSTTELCARIRKTLEIAEHSFW